jgi:bifunctional DNase/RNase
MICSVSQCDQSADYLLTLAERSKQFADRYFCTQHGRMAIDEYVKHIPSYIPHIDTDSDEIPVQVHMLVGGGEDDFRFVYLRNDAYALTIAIKLGPWESMALWNGLKRTITSRPLTHLVLGTLISQLGAVLLRVVIDEYWHRDQVFHAKLIVIQAGVEKRIDVRPSDAISVASYMNVPILVTRRVVAALAQRKS